jgi:hypothetical protein
LDGLVWDWVRHLLSDPDSLARWWRYWDEEFDRNDSVNYIMAKTACVPLAGRLHRAQALLALLHELFQIGVFSRQQYSNRSVALAQEIADTQRELARLRAELAAEPYVAGEEDSYNGYVQSVAASLNAVESSPEARSKLIKSLDVRVVLEGDHGNRTARVRCELGEASLTLPSDEAERWIGQQPGSAGADPSLAVAVPPIDHVERLVSFIPSLSPRTAAEREQNSLDELPF